MDADDSRIVDRLCVLSSIQRNITKLLEEFNKLKLYQSINRRQATKMDKLSLGV